MVVSEIEQDFARIIRLCAEMEGLTLPDRLIRRIARAYDRAIEKALCISWDGASDNAYINRSLFRHAERGARDYLP